MGQGETYEGEERRSNPLPISDEQLSVLIEVADNQLYWRETRHRLAAKGRAWAFVGTIITAVVGGWLALKGLGIGITFGGGNKP